MADVDLVIKRGDDFQLIITVTDGVDPLNLTNYTVSAQVRETTESATVLAEFDASITNAPDGEITLILDHLITADLVDGVWDVEVIDGGNSDWTTTLASGTVTVTPDVTRPII